MSIQDFNTSSHGGSPVLVPRILAIEPDPGIGEMLCEIFRSSGYECKVIRECGDIIPLMESFRPDVVLIEYLLPVVNGGELCSQVKSDARFSGIPVIMYSAFPQILWNVSDYGCDEFIAKPFEVDELVTLVEKWFVKGKDRRRFSFLADTIKNRLGYLSRFIGT